jgi:hypothetical protein
MRNMAWPAAPPGRAARLIEGGLGSFAARR